MLKIGLFATGLDTYWSQFDGLLDHLNDYRRIIAGRINAALTIPSINEVRGDDRESELF